jgi:putative nucleotidyltransferase with HDIG domain
MATALDNAALYQELEELFLGAVKSLTDAVDAKSPWTRGHSERVTAYAMAIGRELGLSETQMKTLRLAGLLHDVGKIGTYDAILDKPDRLTPEEFALVKQHPDKGARIIEDIKQLRDVAEVIRYHHERMDGKGYPYGVKGEAIPLLSRILAVADSFDSMTTDRPYRPAPGEEYAVKELRRCAGTQFDPRVVEAFLRWLQVETPKGSSAKV